MEQKRLWYRTPASNWNEALPIGNGRMGAMVFGRPFHENIQVNEDSIWYGGPMDRNNRSCREKLPEIRELIKAGRIHEAEQLCRMAMSGTPQGMRCYQTLGNIEIDYDVQQEQVTDYIRELDLERAISRTSFVSEDTQYVRELFMSAPADACVMHLTAKGRHKMNVTILQTRHHLCEFSRVSSKDAIILGGRLGEDGVSYACMCKAFSPDGRVETLGEMISVTDATELYLYWSAATTFRTFTSDGKLQMDSEKKEGSKDISLEEGLTALLSKVSGQDYEALKQEHIRDYQSYFRRISLHLEEEKSQLQSQEQKEEELPTDTRLQRFAEGATDLSLQELYFDFGRYLFISCSRPGTLPANLQGIWNEHMEAPWDSKYTININTEMNYWPAEICDLSECHEPLFELLLRMVPNGRKTAEVMYGCRGFVAHHNTDIWGDTAPQDLWIPGSFWVMGAAWLCTHVWTHYEYTGDTAFLQKMFPVMREAATFFLDFMIEHAGYLCTCPSVSPENTFILPTGEKGANGIGVTMDNQILRDLFTQCHKAAVVLGVTDALDTQIQEALSKIRPTEMSRDGRIKEWIEEYEEEDMGHRHISHLYGLHPSTQITKDGTPELAKAAEKTLEGRLSHGGGHTGWSRAWIMNHYAKLWNGEKAYENLRQLLIKSTLPNLFDNHPPFQIDGNFGSIAAMVEMIVQSDENRIVLLPALPKAWKNGSLEGVKVRGNAKMKILWENGILKEAWIKGNEAGERKLVYGEHSTVISMEKDSWIRVVL